MAASVMRLFLTSVSSTSVAGSGPAGQGHPGLAGPGHDLLARRVGWLSGANHEAVYQVQLNAYQTAPR